MGNHQEGFLSSIFLVPKKDGEQRPIINLKRLNNLIPHHHFKMEGIHMLKDLLRQGDCMAKIDLKDTYFAVPVSNQDKKFLRFRWEQNIYHYKCLPFGLSYASWVFTNQGCNGCTRRVRHQTLNLYQRHVDNYGVGDSPKGPCRRNGVPATKPGVCNQLLKICTGAIENLGF